MAKPHFPRRVQQQILDRRDLERTGHGHLSPKPSLPAVPGKTFAMRLMEEKWRVPIKELIGHGSNVEVGNLLTMHPSTISKWRLRLGLR